MLDLNGDGIHTTSPDDPVWFDLTGDGSLDHITWTNPSTMEGFLWIDLQKNGRADDGRELFGVGTRLSDGTRARHGFEALAEHDLPAMGGNGDGRITTADRVWNHLRLWVDGNHDGVSHAHETRPVERYGIVTIHLTYFVDREADENGNYHTFRGSFERRIHGGGAPTVRAFALHDVFFRVVPEP